MHFSCTFCHCPSEHLLSICNFPFSVGLFVTHLFSRKILVKSLFVVKICFTLYVIIIPTCNFPFSVGLFVTHLLAPQSGALTIGAYRDFQSNPTQSTYSFRAFKPFYSDQKQCKQTKADQCRLSQTKAGINFASIEVSKCTSIPSI